MKENISSNSQSRPQLESINNEFNNLDSRVGPEHDKRGLESGRSMVEMLGVLAIVGVLSVGGIAGYSYGMNKHKANVTLQDVNMRMFDVMNQVYQNKSEIAIPEDWDLKGRAGYVIDLFQNNNLEPSIMVEGVPPAVCEIILKDSADTQDIFVGVKSGENVDGNWYLGDNEDICEGSDKEILFALSPEILAGFNPDEGSEEVEGTATIVVTAQECYSNADCHADKPFCENGTCIQCFSDSDCKSRNHYCSDNMCEKCPDDKPFWNASTKKCVECINDSDCTGENELCFSDNTSCTSSNYNTCKTYEIHAETTINGKEWIYVYVDEHYWPSWWDAKKVCAHLGKKLPSVSEMIDNWQGLSGWNNCLNSYDCGYTYTDLAQTVFSKLNLNEYWFWYDQSIDHCSAYNGLIGTSSDGYVGSFGKHYDNHGRRAICHD